MRIGTDNDLPRRSDGESTQGVGKGTGLSVSRFIANLIQEKTATEWPPSVEALVGAWADFPEVEELRADVVDDEPREKL